MTTTSTRTALDAAPVQKVRAYALTVAEGPHRGEQCGRVIMALTGSGCIATLWADHRWPVVTVGAQHFTDRDLYANEALLDVAKQACGVPTGYDPDMKWHLNGADWRTVLEAHGVNVLVVIA